MVLRLTESETVFSEQFAKFLNTKRESVEDVDTIVNVIIADVKENGDNALIKLTKKFDKIDLTDKGLSIPVSEIQLAKQGVPEHILNALNVAYDRIKDYHVRQKPNDERYKDSIGVELGCQWTAIESVGIYVPGGTASYPSSVLMNSIPARVAGVERLVMTVPTPNGDINPLVLVAAELVGIEEIYTIGGAQAIAALTYGTESIQSVDKIVGPGNAFVAAAKKAVFGSVGIDMVAGPSEVVVVADNENDPAWIAADLLAQAEHDTSSQSVLITDDEPFADAVESAVNLQLKSLPRAEIATKSWQKNGAVIIVKDLSNSLELVNTIAPEHLEIATRDPESILKNIRNTGAIFLGKYTPEAIGDYVAGSNHVLPTMRAARFSSGLTVIDFMKRTSILKCNSGNLDVLGQSAMVLAEVEDLIGHQRSVSIRLDK